jgi:hypothetical protein
MVWFEITKIELLMWLSGFFAIIFFVDFEYKNKYVSRWIQTRFYRRKFKRTVHNGKDHYKDTLHTQWIIEIGDDENESNN